MESEEILVKDVAIYLRKSRGDKDTDLQKHRMQLVELCNKMDYSYREYAEIGSSDSIQDRPEFCRLLDDIKMDLFDAIAVVDIDRLGRGDDRDWGLIEAILREAEVFIITPDHNYKWDNDNDEIQLETKKYLARIEYKAITKRLRRGKIWGARDGKWTNGKPPYPYVYNRETGNLDINADHYKVYRQILDMALDGLPAYQIAWELNKLNIKSPGGLDWNNNTVYRLLKDMTHLGKIVFGKQKGSGHKNKKTKPLKRYDQQDWIVIDGRHKAIKTQAEHDKIVELLAKRKIIPKAARKGAFVLSGLVYCSKCGYRMGITKNGRNHIEYLKKCQHFTPIGDKCDNPGADTDYIVQAVFTELRKYEDRILSNIADVKEDETILIRSALKQKQDELQKEEKALNNLYEMREDGEISKDKFLLRKNIRETRIDQINNDVKELKVRLQKRDKATDQMMLSNIADFRKKWSQAESSHDKNQFLKTIIDRINYTRNGENIIIHVNFL
mgnify:CR=1 FL=1